MANQERLVNDFCDLVLIDSPSSEEWDVALRISERLARQGFQVAWDEHGNVIARGRGGMSGFVCGRLCGGCTGLESGCYVRPAF